MIPFLDLSAAYRCALKLVPMSLTFSKAGGTSGSRDLRRWEDGGRPVMIEVKRSVLGGNIKLDNAKPNQEAVFNNKAAAHRSTNTQPECPATDGRDLISVIIPVFNEEGCIAESISRLEQLRERMSNIADFEFIFVNDGSSDATGQIIRDHAKDDKSFKMIELSRNFGHQIAVTAGLDASSGDYVAIIDGDLQDPPELIEEMYARALEGYDVVYGQRRHRLGESFFKNFSAFAFYRILNLLSDTSIPRDTGDFRLISRRVAEALSNMREQNRFLRGMIPWIGFISIPFLYDRDVRRAGSTKYPLRKMLALAMNAITSFSSKPLLLVVRLGLIMVSFGFLAGIYLLYLKIFSDSVVPGVTSILISILVFNGMQILTIGIVGTYVARLFDEVKGRPLYVVESTCNL